jgi:DNA adenine methylase
VVCEPHASKKAFEGHLKYATKAYKPVLTYPGSKGGVINQITSVLNQFPKTENYYEPFIGSASVFFALPSDRVKYAHINDFDPRLKNLYEQLKAGKLRKCKTYIKSKKQFQKAYDRSAKDGCALYNVTKYSFGGQMKRGNFAQSRLDPATKLKTDFLGPEKRLKEADTKITSGSYELALEKIRPNSIVYLDPPYIGTESVYDESGTKSFDGRKFVNFLTSNYRKLKNKNVHFAVSHSYAPRLHALLRHSGIPKSEMKLCRVKVKRRMGNRPGVNYGSRGKLEFESLIVISKNASKVQCDSIPFPTKPDDQKFAKCLIKREENRVLCKGRGGTSTLRKAKKRRSAIRRRADLRLTLSKSK